VKFHLQVVIEAGAETCASKPGKFCVYVRTTNFGTRWVCHFFDRTLNETSNGWLERAPECIQLAKVGDTTKPRKKERA
jgi:hypothetical protein